jgi:hypothetical protein
MFRSMQATTLHSDSGIDEMLFSSIKRVVSRGCSTTKMTTPTHTLQIFTDGSCLGISSSILSLCDVK